MESEVGGGCSLIDAVDVLTPYFRGSMKPDQKGGLLVRSPQSARPISSINPSIDSPQSKITALGWLAGAMATRGAGAGPLFLPNGAHYYAVGAPCLSQQGLDLRPGTIIYRALHSVATQVRSKSSFPRKSRTVLSITPMSKFWFHSSMVSSISMAS